MRIPGRESGSVGGKDRGPLQFTLSGGRSTISRLLFTLPFPLSFSANALQHWEQMSYSLPSISFWRHSLAWLHRSHR